MTDDRNDTAQLHPESRRRKLTTAAAHNSKFLPSINNVSTADDRKFNIVKPHSNKTLRRLTSSVQWPGLTVKTHMVPEVVGTMGMSSASVGMDHGIWNCGASSRITMFLKRATHSVSRCKIGTNAEGSGMLMRNKHGTRGSWHSHRSTSSSSLRSWSHWRHRHRNDRWPGEDRTHRQFAAAIGDSQNGNAHQQFRSRCYEVNTLKAKQTFRATSFSMAESMTG